MPKFQLGDYVRNVETKSQWRGIVCGTYSTDLIPDGYVVESSFEMHSVQCWPATALEEWKPSASEIGGMAELEMHAYIEEGAAEEE